MSLGTQPISPSHFPTQTVRYVKETVCICANIESSAQQVLIDVNFLKKLQMKAKILSVVRMLEAFCVRCAFETTVLCD